MGLVVSGERNPLAVAGVEGAADFPGQVELGLEPERHGHHERPEAARRIGQVGFHQPVELQERLVVEHDVIQLLGGQSGFLQAVVHRVLREVVVVLDAGEAFLLGRRHDLAVFHHSSGAVVVKSGDA